MGDVFPSLLFLARSELDSAAFQEFLSLRP